MYNVHCKDPNCVDCRQASKGQSSEKVKQDKILMTVKELLLFTSNKKTFCVEACKKIKEEIHDKINSLIDVLRERERELCIQADEECYIQMAKIDYDVTAQYVDNFSKTSNESKNDVCINQMVFDSEFHCVILELKKFGQLSYEDPFMHLKNKLVKKSQELNQQFQNSEGTPIRNIALSTIPLNCPFEAEIKNKNLGNVSKISKDEEQHVEECASSVSDKEIENDVFSDEDDMEIISTSEAAIIPSELPSMPPKNRFRFSKKRSCFPSLFCKKPLFMPNNSVSKHPICSENKSHEYKAAFTHEEMNEILQTPEESSIECFNPPLNEQAVQKSSNKCLAASVNFTSSDSKAIKDNLTALMSMAERKKNPSFTEQSSEDSSSKSLGSSCIDFQGHNPSTTLLSSFKKYLEKNPTSEWLVPEKSTEQFLYPDNSCIFDRKMPFLVENVDQWLPTKNNHKMFSDWLYTADV